MPFDPVLHAMKCGIKIDQTDMDHIKCQKHASV